MSACSEARRFLAIFLPRLATDRLRREPSSAFSALPAEAPLVVVDKVQNALRLVALDARARALGLETGLALADARARIPDLAVAETASARDAVLLAQIGDWCDRFTPIVAVDLPDGLVLDITGCAHLAGGEGALIAKIIGDLERSGICAVGAIAGAPDAARALARFGAGGIVPPGEDAMRVAPLPVAALALPTDVAVALVRMGLKRIGDLMDRPRAPLAARFGASLLVALDRTTGALDAPISPRRIVPVCRTEQRFAEPITESADILAVLAELAASLCATLEERGLGGRRFEASFFRVDGAVRRLTIATARATREAKPLARLFADKLDTLAEPLESGFGFDIIRLGALVTEPLSPAQGRLDGARDAQEDVASLIDRLSVRFGPERVLRFEARDTHIPERTQRLVPALSTPRKQTTAWEGERDAGEPPRRPMSLFNPPQPIEAVAEVPDGPPLRFRWRRVLHRVVTAEGPERIAPEWWRSEGAQPTRDYYRIEDADGRRFWVFRAGLYGRETGAPRWFLHGLFP